MQLNQKSTNFYCSKDNAFSHYMKQKYLKKYESDEKQDLLQSYSPRQQNDGYQFMNDKISRKEKSITQLVQFFNSPLQKQLNPSHISANLYKSDQQNLKSQNEKSIKQQKILSSIHNPFQANSKLILDTNGNKSSICQTPKNLTENLKTSPQPYVKDQIFQSVDRIILSEPAETIQLVLPSKYFNSPSPRDVYSKRMDQQKSLNKVKQISINQQSSESNLNTLNSQKNYTEDESSNTKRRKIKLMERKVNEIIIRHSPRASYENQNISNLWNIMKKNDEYLMSPQTHQQSSIKKNKMNKYDSKKKLNTLKNSSSQHTENFIERDFMSPFGDAQFDLVMPSYSNYSRQIEKSDVKERSSTTFEIPSPNRSLTKKSQNFESNSPPFDYYELSNIKLSQQTKFSDQIQLQDQQQQDYLQQPPNKPENNKNFNINISNIQSKINKQSEQFQDGLSFQSQSQDINIDTKQEKSNTEQTDIAYNKFTIKRQNTIKPEQKKKDERSLSPDQKNSQSNRRKDTSTIEQSKQNQQQNKASRRKKNTSQNQLSRDYSQFNDDDSDLNLFNDYFGQKSSFLNLPQIYSSNNAVPKKNYVKSMQEIKINKVFNTVSQQRLDLPIITSQTNLNQSPTLTALDQGQQQFDRNSNKKRKTEIYKNANNIRKKNRLYSQRTLEVNHQYTQNEAGNKSLIDDLQLNLNSSNHNYYQALMDIKKEEAQLISSKLKVYFSNHQKNNSHNDSSVQTIDENEGEQQEDNNKKISKLKRNKSLFVQFEQELIESIRHLKGLIAQDDQMKLFIHTFCFIEVEEFCFLLGLFLDQIYGISTEAPQITGNQVGKTVNKINNQNLNGINSQRHLTFANESYQNIGQGSMTNINASTEIVNPNEQQVFIQSIQLPSYGLEKIEQLLKQSFIHANVNGIEEKMEIFSQNKKILLPDNLLDEIGGRIFIEKIFVVFIKELIDSKEFSRDIQEEQQETIFTKAMNPQQNKIYIQIICEFLKENTDHLISDLTKDKIKAQGIQLSSIDFFVLKKRLYKFLQKQDLVITNQQILKIVSRLNQLRQIICNDVLFIRNPQNLERHIFLTLKSFIVSTHFVKSASTQSLMEITNQIINYITLHITPDAFIKYLYTVVQEDNIFKFIESLEFISTQAFEIYSYLSIEDKADLKTKFSILRQKLGFERSISQIFPVPLSQLLKEVSEWVQNQITDEPLPKEILLKNLENTEMLEIILQFSHPDVDAFNYHDSYAAFSYYNFTKLQYNFQVRGFMAVLSKYNLPESDLQLVENFLKQIFPDRHQNTEQVFKLNKQSEQMFNEQFKTASERQIQINIPIQKSD